MSDQTSPVGTAVSDHIAESRRDPDFRAEHERLRPYEEFARVVIRRRAELGLSQGELAARMGVATSTVSRIESGQHAVDSRVFRKLGEILGFADWPKPLP